MPDFDLCNGDADHRVVAIQLEWQEHTWYQRHSKKKPRVDRSSITSSTVMPGLLDIQAPAWTADIAQHIETYTQDLHHCLAERCPLNKEAGKKTFFPLSLWKLRDQKLAAKKKVTAIGGRYKIECLRAVFQQWHSIVNHVEVPSPVLFFNHTITLWCWRLKYYVELKILAAKLKKLLQQSRHAAMTEALQELPVTASANDILKVVKLFVGPTNVKHLKKKTLPMLLDEDGQPCGLPAQLLSRWITFFGDMEGGVRIDEEEQWTRWRTNLQRFRNDNLVLTVEDVPTLTDLELAFRRVPRNKASGLDNIPSELCSACPAQLARQMYGALLKLVLHGQESLEHKGGILTPAHKGKGPLTDPAAYRSLLVSSHLGKTLHRTVRQRQATLLETYMARSQLGGKRRVPVTLGLHEARAFLRAAVCQRNSAVLLMVDLAEAFYRVLRPLALGSAFTDSDIAHLVAKLKMPHEVLHQLRDHLAQPSAVMLAGMPLHYQRAIQAIHEDTFFQMPGQEDVCRTSVGSRPGDSFADIVFTFLFSRVLQNCQQKLQAQELQEYFRVDPAFDPFAMDHLQQREMHAHTGPVWMDDLCVTISSGTAEGALNKAGVISSLLMDTLEEHAMLPNLRKGKTELLISLRGPGVRAAKARFFGPCCTGLMPIVGEHMVRHITVVGEYQHLGGLLHHTGDHRKEMRKRVALAHQAFSSHRRQIFQNQDLPLIKRTQLFESLVLTKLLYGCESWHLADQRSKSFLHSAVLRLYKRLLRVPHDCAWTDEEVCVALSLPTPTELLRRARLRYIGTLHRCEGTVAWGLLHADFPWCELIKDDLLWMWHQLRRSSSLTNPAESLEAWRYLRQYHTSYWKGLIRRAIRHACLQRQNALLVSQAHLDILDDLTQHRVICPGPLPQDLRSPSTAGVFGCMCCQKMFRSRAGEGAHMFRCHRLISNLRWLFDTTSCPSCLRGFHTFGRLHAHLRHQDHCRNELQNRGPLAQPAAGIGSAVNDEQERRANGLQHPLQGFGPLPRPEPQRDVQHYDIELYGEITEILIQQLPECRSQAVREAICRRPISWSSCVALLRAFKLNATMEDVTAFGFASQVDFELFIDSLLDSTSWTFLNMPVPQEAIPALPDLEKAMRDAEVLQAAPAPRAFGVHRLVLHAFSGRRRPGDFQEFLEAIVSKHSGFVVHVVSVDIILNSTWGDVTSPDCQNYWFHGVKSKFVIGYLAGPPCETWSKAREHSLGDAPDVAADQRARGPRVLRTLDELWGQQCLAVREVLQVFVGNQLLLFSFRMMILLHATGAVGALEHPAPPSNPTSASIWRTEIAMLLSRLPGFERIDFAQGLLGAKSPKPTSILALRLPDLARQIRQGRVCDDLPQAASIGRDALGRWQTSSLKEYPPAMCRALAASFASAIAHSTVDPDISISPSFWDKCADMVVSDYSKHIGPDFAG